MRIVTTHLRMGMRLILCGLALTATLTALPAAAADKPANKPKDWPSPIHDNQWIGKLLVDRLEYAWGKDRNTANWDIKGWYGGDYNRVWFRSEGEDVAAGGNGGEGTAQLRYSRLVAPYWEAQAGVGYQSLYGPGPNHERAFGVIGMQGLAPYWFDIDAALKVSKDGDTWATLDAEYQWLFTQRLILSPRFSTSVAAQRVDEFGVGKGVNYVQLGLRLRYEIRREFAPYVGVSWKRLEGETADLARAEGEERSQSYLLAGVRMWF